MEIQINLTAVLVATGANFVLSFLWYGLIFGKAWAREMKLDTSVKPTGGQIAKGLVITFIGNLLMAWVFAHNIAAWSFVPGMKEAPVAGNIISSAVFTWLGFYLPMDLNVVAWESKSWKLVAINTGSHLAMLFVAAIIIMYM